MKKVFKIVLITVLSLSITVGLLYFNIVWGGYYENPESAVLKSNQPVHSVIDTDIYDNEAVVFFVTHHENVNKPMLGIASLTSKQIRGKLGWAIVGLRGSSLENDLPQGLGRYTTYNLKSTEYIKLNKLQFGVKETSEMTGHNNYNIKDFTVGETEYTLWYTITE